MIPLFTTPLALWGLLAIPALLAIYWLRNRFRRHPVSSLMLWLDPPRAYVTHLRRPLLDASANALESIFEEMFQNPAQHHGSTVKLLLSHIESPSAGELTVEFEPTLATMAATAASDTSACTP